MFVTDRDLAALRAYLDSGRLLPDAEVRITDTSAEHLPTGLTIKALYVPQPVPREVLLELLGHALDSACTRFLSTYSAKVH